MRLVSIFFFLIILSCSKEIKVEKNQFTYLALGDSYTIGKSVDEIYRWPIQLKFKLIYSDEGIPID